MSGASELRLGAESALPDGVLDPVLGKRPELGEELVVRAPTPIAAEGGDLVSQ